MVSTRRGAAVALGALALLMPALGATVVWNEWSQSSAGALDAPVVVGPGDDAPYGDALLGPAEAEFVEDPLAPADARVLRVRIDVDPGDPALPCAEPILRELDARRAIQTVRARAADYRIDPHRIVLIGFSAGGHLAALAATQPVPGDPNADDPIARVSSRPDYLVLGYPWIGAISSDTSPLSYCQLYKVMDRCEALRKAYSPDLFVSKETPPTFWYHTFNDETVPLEQGMRFYQALMKAGVPAEAHIFAKGPHGTGLGKGDASLDQWPALLETWLRAQGLLTQAKAAENK